MKEYYSLNNTHKTSVEFVGGKGFSLIQAREYGFNVPDAFILSTYFFKPWLDQIYESDLWKKFLSDNSEITYSKLEQVALELNSNDMQKSVLKKLIPKFKRSRYAIRSSSPDEDTENLSFSGIYKSILGVKVGDIQKAIKECFSSLFTEQVILYKKTNNYQIDNLNYACIIQEQIPAETSGVAFSLNPITNYYDEVVINANFGLGETVVNGSIESDQILIDKVKRKITEIKIGSKEKAIYIADDGYTQEKLHKDSEKLCIEEQQILEIHDLVCSIEKQYQKPVDIEWAYSGTELYLLQARPITTYFKLPEEIRTKPGEPKRLYVDGLLTEQGLVESLSPLGADILQLLVVEGFRPLGIHETLANAMAIYAKGRFYNNIGTTSKLSGIKAIIKGVEIVDIRAAQTLRQMNMKPYIPRKMPPGIGKSMLRMIGSGIGSALKTMKAYNKPDEYLEFFINENNKLDQQFHLEFHNTTNLNDFTIKVCILLGEWLNYISLPTLYASFMARSKIKKMFKKLGNEILEQLPLLERAFPNNVTIDMGMSLFKLSQFSDLNEIHDERFFLKKISKKSFSQTFMDDWDHFNKNFGFRGPGELDIATKRYYENPEDVFKLLKSMSMNKNLHKAPDQLILEGIRIREELYQTLLAKLKSKHKKKLFKKRYKVLECFVAYREIHKYYMIMAMDLIRRKILTIAKEWVKEKRIDKVDDIFFINYCDINKVLSTENIELKSVVQKNRAIWNEYNTNKMPPALFDSRGYIPSVTPKELKENEFIGTPASPGIVSGPVKVLSKPTEKEILPGDILVTQATDPGWTPLFLNAAGVLIQNGGVLQHGASVARESCKPCIVGLQDITVKLTDSQYVELDGSTGLVKILE